MLLPAGVGAAVLAEPCSQITLLVFAEVDAGIDPFHGLLQCALGRRNFVFTEETLYVITRLCAAKALRGVDNIRTAGHGDLLLHLIPMLLDPGPCSLLDISIA